MDKWDFIKFKSFCTTKEMVSKLKRPPPEWEETFASYTSDKKLITRIYRELKKLNFSQINEPIKKWATELNRTFSKEEIQRQKHMKECSSSLAIKEMQIKTTLDSNSPVLELLTAGVGEAVGKKEHFYTAGGNAS
jgi:hypothetical protein